MEKSITTAIFTVAAVTVSMLFVNALVPRMQTGSQAAATAAARLESRIRTDLSILHTAAETTGGQHYIRVWLKNTGSTTVEAVDRMDVFLSTTSGTAYIPKGSAAGQWQITLLDGSTTWIPMATARLDLILATPAAGTYTLSISTASGAEVRKTFSF